MGNANYIGYVVVGIAAGAALGLAGGVALNTQLKSILTVGFDIPLLAKSTILGVALLGTAGLVTATVSNTYDWLNGYKFDQLLEMSDEELSRVVGANPRALPELPSY